jgi:hypothetical protein
MPFTEVFFTKAVYVRDTYLPNMYVVKTVEIVSATQSRKPWP